MLFDYYCIRFSFTPTFELNLLILQLWKVHEAIQIIFSKSIKTVRESTKFTKDAKLKVNDFIIDFFYFRPFLFHYKSIRWLNVFFRFFFKFKILVSHTFWVHCICVVGSSPVCYSEVNCLLNEMILICFWILFERIQIFYQNQKQISYSWQTVFCTMDYR